MKTMLHFSFALMLIAGAAGATDFAQMFRSGEIDKIYDEGSSSMAHGGRLKPSASVNELMTNVKELNFEDFSRAPLKELPVVENPSGEETPEVAKNEVVTTEVATPVSPDKTDNVIEAAVPVVSLPVEPKQEEASVGTDTKVEIEEVSKEFSLERFSRAPLPQKVKVYRVQELSKKEKRELKREQARADR